MLRVLQVLLSVTLVVVGVIGLVVDDSPNSYSVLLMADGGLLALFVTLW